MAIRNHVDHCWPLACYNKLYAMLSSNNKLYAMLSSNISRATHNNASGCKAVDPKCVLHHWVTTIHLP